MLQGRLAQILSKLTSVLCPLAQLCDGDNLQLPKLSSINPSHLTTIVWISDQTNPEIKTDIVKGQEISEAIFLGFSLAPPWNGNYQNRAYLILRG